MTYGKMIVLRYYGTILTGINSRQELNGWELRHNSATKMYDWTLESARERAKQDATRFSGRIEIVEKHYDESCHSFVYNVLDTLSC